MRRRNYPGRPVRVWPFVLLFATGLFWVSLLFPEARPAIECLLGNLLVWALLLPFIAGLAIALLGLLVTTFL